MTTGCADYSVKINLNLQNQRNLQFLKMHLKITRISI